MTLKVTGHSENALRILGKPSFLGSYGEPVKADDYNNTLFSALSFESQI